MMKRLFSLLCVLATALLAQAQFTHVWQNGTATDFLVSEMAFSASGTQLTINGTTYATSAIDSLTFSAAPQGTPRVSVTYSNTSATVSIPEYMKSWVSATVNGAHVAITNTNEETEIELEVKGTTTDGSLTYTASFKSSIVLDNVQITNPTGTAIDIQCGKRIDLDLIGNNVLTDKAGDQKGCLYCKGHLEIGGGGNLTINANANHGIATKEYLQLKRTCGTITIAKAANDAIHVGQYFQMNGGVLNIDANTKGDGVQVETTNSAEDEHNGEIIVKGGTLNIAIANEDCKAMKCDNIVTISGGTFNIRAIANGSRGIQTDGNLIIGEEDGETKIYITAEGAKCTQTECALDPHRCMGVKVNNIITMNAGLLHVENTGKGSRAIKCGLFTHNGGTLEGEVTY